MPAVLAIWADCKPGHEALFEQWYQQEHLPERLALPGFRRGRRYEAIDDAAHFMTCYQADEAAVFASPAYLARLNDPTPLTQQVMSMAMQNLSRTICDRYAAGGLYTGAYALTVKLETARGATPAQASTVRDAKALLDTLLPTHADFARYEIWLANPDFAPDLTAPLSAEQSLRGRDQTISGCVFIETLREAHARELQALLCQTLNQPVANSAIYRLLCDAQSE